MKKIILYFLVAVFSLSCIEIHANVSRANSLKRTLTIQYNRLNKTPTGKVRILKDIANLSQKYSKDNDVINLLKKMKNTYKVATECDIGFYLKEGQCLTMNVVNNGILPTNENSTKSTSTDCKLGTYLNNGKCVEMAVLDNGIRTDSGKTNISTSSSKNDTKASLLQQINNVQSAIDSAKITLEKGKNIISETDTYIALYNSKNVAYQAKINTLKTDYGVQINNTRNQIDIDIQQSNIYYARLGIQLSFESATAIVNRIKDSANKLIEDLTAEMNSNIAIVQSEIDKNNIEIRKLQAQNDEHRNTNTNLGLSIQKMETSLETLRNQYNSL